jgi:hypothetical protein
MKYNIKGDNVRGSVDVNITLLEQLYIINYDASLNIGKMIFGKFVKLNSQQYKNSIEVSKQYLSEEWLKQNKEASIRGLKLVKVTDLLWKFSKNSVHGDIYFNYDGIDPVEVMQINLTAPIVGSIKITKA